MEDAVHWGQWHWPRSTVLASGSGGAGESGGGAERPRRDAPRPERSAEAGRSAPREREALRPTPPHHAAPPTPTRDGGRRAADSLCSRPSRASARRFRYGPGPLYFIRRERDAVTRRARAATDRQDVKKERESMRELLTYRHERRVFLSEYREKNTFFVLARIRAQSSESIHSTRQVLETVQWLGVP